LLRHGNARTLSSSSSVWPDLLRLRIPFTTFPFKTVT